MIRKEGRVARERERDDSDRNQEIGSERKKMKYLNVRLNYCAQPTRTKLPTPHLPHRYYYTILTHYIVYREVQIRKDKFCIINFHLHLALLFKT